MPNENYSIRFYLNKNKKLGDKQTIYLRIIVDRKKVELATNHHLAPHEWNEKLQRPKKNQLVLNGMLEIEYAIRTIISNYEKEKRPFTASQIKRAYTGEENEDASLLLFFQNYIERIEQAGELEPGTISRYKDTLDHLDQFLTGKKLRDLQVSHVNYKLIDDFDLYLLKQPTKREAGKLTRNTANKHHTRFKTILLRAMNEGLLQINPYLNFKVKYNPSKRTFLTRAELDSIINYSFAHNRTLDTAKDIFLFSCYTGLRFADAQELNMNQINKRKDGKFNIQLSQAKTKEQVSIPLLKPALDIIGKYDNEERKITGKVLPKMSNQRINIYLKEIANIVGIEKELSHHVARHTCATTILLSNEVSLEEVGKWLGHNNHRTTQIYAKITQEHLQSVANKLESKI